MVTLSFSTDLTESQKGSRERTTLNTRYDMEIWNLKLSCTFVESVTLKFSSKKENTF